MSNVHMMTLHTVNHREASTDQRAHTPSCILWERDTAICSHVGFEDYHEDSIVSFLKPKGHLINILCLANTALRDDIRYLQQDHHSIPEQRCPHQLILMNPLSYLPSTTWWRTVPAVKPQSPSSRKLCYSYPHAHTHIHTSTMASALWLINWAN